MKKLLMTTAVVAGLTMVSFAAHAEGGKRHGKAMGGDHQKIAMEHFLKAHDADGDGAVSQEEFMKTAEDRFHEMDADSDGMVTGEEITAHHAALRTKMMEEWKSKRQEGGAPPPPGAGPDGAPPPPPPEEEAPPSE